MNPSLYMVPAMLHRVVSVDEAWAVTVLLA